jgi:hypothetical protein
LLAKDINDNYVCFTRTWFKNDARKRWTFCKNAYTSTINDDYYHNDADNSDTDYNQSDNDGIDDDGDDIGNDEDNKKMNIKWFYLALLMLAMFIEVSIDDNDEDGILMIVKWWWWFK